MADTSSTIQNLKCLSFREHALTRPEAYVGTLEPSPFTTYIVENQHEAQVRQESGQHGTVQQAQSPQASQAQAPAFVWQEFGTENRLLSKPLMTVANEIISNAVDQQRNGAKQIHIQYDPTYGDITVRDDGGGIAVERWNTANGTIILEDHLRGVPRNEMPWIPTVLFSQDKSGSKFDDDDDRTGMTGRFGYGAKATNVYCKRFQVETVDPTKGLKFQQTWFDNLSRVSNASITKSKLKKGYTEIRFLPDYEKLLGQPFNASVSDVFGRWLLARAYDVVACSGSKKATVYWNEEKLQLKSLKEFAQAMARNTEQIMAYDEIQSSNNGSDSVGSSSGVISNLQIAVIPIAEDDSATGHGIVGIVNGLPCSEGTLVDYIIRKIIAALKSCSKKEITPKPAYVRRKYTIVAVATLANPSYTNVTKDRLTLACSKFGFDWEPGPAFIKKIALPHIIADLENDLDMKDVKSLSALVASKRSRNGAVHVDKYDGANYAGHKGHHCELILTEGDSAKDLAITGRAVVGSDHYGVFPLRGKLKNVRDMTPAEIAKDIKDEKSKNEIPKLMKIIGLRYGDSSQKITDLRYQQITVFTDQDADGSHIFALVYSWIHKHYPHLLKQNPNFIRRFISPIMKIWPKNGKETSPQAKYFYTLPDVQKWTQESPDNDISKFRVRYYKGLGSSSNIEARYYFSHIADHVVDVSYTGLATDDCIQLLFDPKREQDRKQWLRDNYNPESAINYTLGNVSFEDFATLDYTHFCMEANTRALPNVIDGLKPSQRKILYVFLTESSLVHDIKVSEAAGLISKKTAYHHGAVSLENAIIGMARDFMGANNINYLVPQGQHGSRLSNHNASARYLFTRLNPVTKLLFRPEDNSVLEYEVSEGTVVEPKFYVPVIPALLVNGSDGMGVGWSCNHVPGNPFVIIDFLLSWLSGVPSTASSTAPDYEAFDNVMIPWFEGFKGQIFVDQSKNKVYARGQWTTTQGQHGTILHITELPPGTWISPFVDNLKAAFADSKNTLITELVPDCSESNVSIRITMNTEQFEKQVPDIETYFKLANSKSLNLSNRHAFNVQGRLEKYSMPSDILREFIKQRVRAYEVRKQNMMDKMLTDSVTLRNKCRFVREVINGQIKPTQTKKQELINVLHERKYDASKSTKNIESDDDNVVETMDYNYLLKMSIMSFTIDLADELEKKLQDIMNQYELLKTTSVSQLWIRDLQELRQGIELLYKDRESERLDRGQTLDAQGQAQTKTIKKRARAGPSGAPKAKKLKVAK